MPSKRVVIRTRLKRIARRRKHIKKIVQGTTDRPRLVVYRSNRHIYAQIVNDESHLTICGCSTLTPDLLEQAKAASGKIEQAKLIGQRIAEIAGKNGISKVRFDRNGRVYHGRVKVLADAARKAGLEF